MNEKGLEIQKKMCIKMLSVPVEFWLHLAQWNERLYIEAFLLHLHIQEIFFLALFRVKSILQEISYILMFQFEKKSSNS